jgi:hypothetical protein
MTLRKFENYDPWRDSITYEIFFTIQFYGWELAHMSQKLVKRKTDPIPDQKEIKEYIDYRLERDFKNKYVNWNFERIEEAKIQTYPMA